MAEPKTPAPTITTSGSGASGGQPAEALSGEEDLGSVLFLPLCL